MLLACSLASLTLLQVIVQNKSVHSSSLSAFFVIDISMLYDAFRCQWVEVMCSLFLEKLAHYYSSQRCVIVLHTLELDSCWFKHVMKFWFAREAPSFQLRFIKKMSGSWKKLNLAVLLWWRFVLKHKLACTFLDIEFAPSWSYWYRLFQLSTESTYCVCKWCYNIIIM